jgi:hypothetical protein
VTRRRAVLLAALASLAAAAPRQQGILRYSASILDCSRWAESSRSKIETVTNRRSGEATAGRRGVLALRARDSAGGVAIEAWFDSVAVWRRSGGEEIAPDTDGLIGGRYRGLLGARGGYTAVASPFVPDDVAEVAELAGVMDDLFPALPSRPLAPGQDWRSAEYEIRRIADTLVAGRPRLRFATTARRERDETIPRGDTVPVPIRQTITEEGELTWDPADGLLRRVRTIVIETSISAGGRIRQPVRSRVEQQVELTRLSPGTCR